MSRELLWLRHVDSSGTQMKGKVRCLKLLPEDIGEGIADREDLVCA
jgi:hypothetical protein